MTNVPNSVHSTNKGYTLAELLVVTTIIAIMSSIAYKSFNTYMRHTESVKIRGDLQNFLTTGKQYALIYQNPIYLCIANEHKQCVTTNGSILLTFIDKDMNKAYSQSDVLLEVNSLNINYGHLITSVALAKPYIIFSAETGRPTGYMGHIKYCPTNADPKEMYKVSFSKTAIIKVKMRQEEDTDC